MNRPLKVVALLCLAVGVLYATWKYHFPTNSFRYRLTVEMSVDGQPVTGTGVIEVTERRQPRVGASLNSAMSIKGEAVVIDLGRRGLLFVLLKGATYASEPGQIIYSTFPPPTPHGAGAALPENLRRYQTQKLRAELSPGQLPMLVRFRDLNDPMAAERVDPNDLAGTFGAGIKLGTAAIETTHDPITSGIERRLPWLKTLKGYLHGGSTSLGAPLGLDKGDFQRAR